MSKHLQARKVLSLNTGIFGLSSIGLVGKTIANIVFGGFWFWSMGGTGFIDCRSFLFQRFLESFWGS